MMKTFVLTGSLVLTGFCTISESFASSTTQQKPNILIILLDDAGYNDFGFMGNRDLETPNIDYLASQGAVFSDAHVSATVSGPSRAGILTGRYQQRFGYECNQGEAEAYLPLTEQTLGDVFKQNGYTTACIGKWHQGTEAKYHPNRRGFDYFYGFLSGGRSYFYNPVKQDKPGSPSNLLENNTQQHFGTSYLTDLFGEKASDFVANTSNPFMMYLSFNAVHTPMEATAEDLARYEGHPRQKLAAMTWAVDRAIGKVTTLLKEQGRLDNTLIFFLSDNGGAHNNQSSNYPLKGFKGNKYEGGHRVPFFAVWNNRFKQPANGVFDGLISSLDIFATAINAAGIDPSKLKNPLDGQNLLPYLTGETKGSPHDQLFWRKDKMAATRMGDYKLITAEGIGDRLYNLSTDPQESNDLSQLKRSVYMKLKKNLASWESEMIKPLWNEGEQWNAVTSSIFLDLMNNRPVRHYAPSDLRKK